MKTKMNTKNLLVSFCTLAIVLFFVATISASSASDLATINSVEINGVNASSGQNIAVSSGDTVAVKVVFTSLQNASNVKLRIEMLGNKLDAGQESTFFDVENGSKYVKYLSLTVPYALEDQPSDDVHLEIKLWNGNFKTEDSNISLRIQKPSYKADIMSISTSQKVSAGDLFPVEVVLKNTGYDRLNDVYVTVSIPALNVEKSSYFRDIATTLENSDSNDYIRGKFYLRIPYDAVEGIYTIEAKAENNDLTTSATQKIVVNNDFPKDVVVKNLKATAKVNQDATYTLLLVNPTNKLKVFKITTDNDCKVCDVSSSVDKPLVAVPAGLSKEVTVTASASKEGEHFFNVNVYSGNKLESTTRFSLVTEGTSRANNTIAVLTIILAVIFLVLLVVLIVLIGKKPKKTEDLGESYY